MLVERPLDGVPTEDPHEVNDAHFKTTDDPNAAKEFLLTNPWAKIVFIVHTHSQENGAFVYSGKENSIEGCKLLEVSLP